MQRGKSKVGAVERILVEEGTRKQVWGDSIGEPKRELSEENVRWVRRGNPQDKTIV